MPHVRNPFFCVAITLVTLATTAFLHTAQAQIPTFDNGPPLLSPGTDRALATLIKDLQASIKEAPKPSDSNWSSLPANARALLVFRRAALALAIRADAIGQNGHPHALAARQLADAADAASLLTIGVDEALIDHAAKEIESPWPEDAGSLASELRRRLGIFISGTEAQLAWPSSPGSSSPLPLTKIDAIDKGVRQVQDAFAPTLPLIAFAPLRNHTRHLLDAACTQAAGSSKLTTSALSIYHPRFTSILDQLKLTPFQTDDLHTLVSSAELIITLFPPANAKVEANVLSTLSVAERDLITRFAISSGPKVMTSDRIDTIQRWHMAMQRLAIAAGKPRGMPPALRQLDKVITSRAAAASKDGVRGLVDLFRPQTSPRDPAVLAGLTALRNAQEDLDAIDNLRILFSTGETWDPSFPLAATRFTKLGVDFQNNVKRDAALTTLRAWSTGTDLLESINDPSYAVLTDPSCITTAKRIETLASSLLDRKKSLLNQKSDPAPATLDALHKQMADLRTLAAGFRNAAPFLQLPGDSLKRRSLFALTPGLYLTDPTYLELQNRARATMNTLDSTLESWNSGTSPTPNTIRQLVENLTIFAAIGQSLHRPAIADTQFPPLFYLLCGTPPTQTNRAMALSVLCRTIEAQVAAQQARDATATPLLTLARSCAERIER